MSAASTWHHRQVSYTRVIAAVAVLTTLGACTADKHTPAFNPTPKPTQAGKPVVVAGTGDAGSTLNGEFALRTPVSPVGPVAPGPDGTLYLPIRQDNGKSVRIARLAPDGRIHVIGPALNWGVGSKLTVGAGKLWVLRTGANSFLGRYSLSGTLESTYFDRTGSKDAPVFVNDDFEPLPKREQKGWRERWVSGEHSPSAVAVGSDGSDGIPVVASRSGELFQALGGGEIRPWRPAGYAAAFERLVARGESDAFTRNIDSLFYGPSGSLNVLASAGVIRITGRAQVMVTPIDYTERPGHGFTWAGGVAFENGTLILVSQADPPTASLLVQVDSLGRISRIRPNWPRTCAEEPESQAGGRPGNRLIGSARRADGSIAVADLGCHRLYALKVPAQ